MSPPSIGYNGSTNSNYQQASRRYGDDDRDTGSEGSREYRIGGYGALSNDHYSAGTSEQTYGSIHQGPEASLNGSHGSLRSGRRNMGLDDISGSEERNTTGSNNPRSYGDGPGARQIEGVLEHIQDKWDVMTKDDCLPVHVALQLMDHSSLGRGGDYHDFQKTSKQLQKALKAIVNEHHQGFNSSIGTFHNIQSSIQASQTRVRMLKESMHNAKSNLMVSKPELGILGSSCQNYEDMLHVLGQIEKLQLVPEQLDARISEKHFLAAVEILQDGLRMIRKSEMENIGALADLRVYFSNQETVRGDFRSQEFEELHEHLYLKSPYCQDRWKSYTADSGRVLATKNEASTLPDTWGRPLYQFLNNLDTSRPLEDDASRNPEIDSFQYMYMILESLNKVGHLDVAVDRLEQRLPIELFKIVEKTNQEVDQRHRGHMRDIQKYDKGISDFDLDGTSSRSHVLKDLLWTLYSKFEAIAEGHRAVHDVVTGIVRREGLPFESLTGGFKEMWKLYQSEIRSILHDYLATDGNPYRLGRDTAGEANIFQKHPRDKSKRVFKFAGLDKKSPDLVNEQEALDQILLAAVPGLVSKSLGRSDDNADDNDLTNEASVAGHKLLIDPNVFNISLLLPPSLSFLQRLKDIVPLDSDIKTSTLTSFLDDFLVNVFQPQLEETITELCAQSFIELDAFQQDPQWSQQAARPIFRGTSIFYVLVRAFCQLLDSIPQDPIFTQLVMSQIVAYYDKCCGWYKALVVRARKQPEESAYLKFAAAMADTGDLRDITEKLWAGDSMGSEAVLEKEIDLLISKTNETPLEPFDIISDRRSVEALCLLYSSMQWLATRLGQLRHVTSQSSLSQRESSSLPFTRRWTALSSTASYPSTPVHLPLTSESVSAFDKTLTSIRSLATTALLTLHLDIRAGIIHMLNRTLSTPYILPHPTTEPDRTILDLNSDLLSFDDTLSTHLPAAERTFITTGLAALVDTFLVRNAGKIRAMNRNGCGRMQLNILVLQQNLKAVESGDHVVLGRSARFFDLFLEGAAGVVEQVKAAAKAKAAGAGNGDGEAGDDEAGAKALGFSLEEMKVLVELCYSEDLGSSTREVTVAAKRGLSGDLLALSEVLWDA